MKYIHGLPATRAALSQLDHGFGHTESSQLGHSPRKRNECLLLNFALFCGLSRYESSRLAYDFSLPLTVISVLIIKEEMLISKE